MTISSPRLPATNHAYTCCNVITMDSVGPDICILSQSPFFSVQFVFAQIAIKMKRMRASRRMGLRISRRTQRRRLGLEMHLKPQVCFISFILHTLLTINHLAHFRFTTSPISVPPPHPSLLETRVGGAPVFLKNVFVSSFHHHQGLRCVSKCFCGLSQLTVYRYGAITHEIKFLKL